MIVSRRIAWIVLLGAILTAGILRQFHARIPTSPFLPAPIGSLLFFLLVILALLFARGWGKRQEIPYAGPGLSRVNFLAFVPLMIALMLEKWVSITLYDPLFSWLDGWRISEATFERLFIVGSAVVLLAVCLVLLPLFQRLFPLLKASLAPSRLPVAAITIGLALFALYAGLYLLFAAAGGESVRLRWSGLGRGAGLLIVGQFLIAFAEELYYRGILQSELAFLLPSIGIVKERARALVAIALISFAFALEHYVATGRPSQDARRVLFAFACSLLLGYMYSLSKNLWLCTGSHLVLNLLALVGDPRHGGLRFVDDEARPVLGPQVYIFLFFIATFCALYLREFFERRSARRYIRETS